MRKQFVCLAVICVIAVAAFVSISIYREDVRSDLVPVNDSLDGGLFGKVGATIDGEPYEIAELYSQIRPVYSDGDSSYCELLMIVTSNAEGRPSFSLHYSYFSDSKSLVPEDAQSLPDEGSYQVFEYTDGSRGDIIRFYVSDERIQTVDVVGSTVVRVGDGFKPLDYDMSVDYDGSVTSINRVMEMDPTPTKVYRIQGHENGERLEGTIIRFDGYGGCRRRMGARHGGCRHILPARRGPWDRLGAHDRVRIRGDLTCRGFSRWRMSSRRSGVMPRWTMPHSL